MMVHLERIGPARSVRRFYRATVTPSLFGEWVLTREWGRIGCVGGQRMEDWFDDETRANVAFERLVAAKRRKGYRASEGDGIIRTVDFRRARPCAARALIVLGDDQNIVAQLPDSQFPVESKGGSVGYAEKLGELTPA